MAVATNHLGWVVDAGGSWIVPKPEIKAGEFEKITALCKEALSLRTK